MAWNISNILVNEAIANKKSGGGSSDLTSRVTALEETVGDESSGLVKDVDDLETTVGDSSSGLVKAVSDLYPNDYSLTEVKVGSWLGQDRYRKVISVGPLPGSATTVKVASGLSDVTVVSISGYGKNSTNNNIIPLPNPDPTGTSVIIYYVTADNEIAIKTSGNVASVTEAYVVLEYIKNPAPEPENNTRKRGK